LLRKNQPWKWGPTEENSFQELKQKICEVTQIGTPRGKGEMVLDHETSEGSFCLKRARKIGSNDLYSHSKDSNCMQ
jgi:hypothetical protein